MPTLRLLATLVFASVALAGVAAYAMHVVPQAPTVTVEAPFTVQEFLRRDNRPLFLREPIAQSLSKEDLPYLYGILEDDSHFTQWNKTLLAICVLEEAHAALEVVKKFVTRSWDWRDYTDVSLHARTRLRNRLWAIRNLAMIAPEVSGPFLTNILSTENATAFLKNFGALPVPGKDAKYTEEYLVRNIQQATASALLHTRSQKLFEYVEKDFHRIALETDEKGYWKDVRLLFLYARLLAKRDVYLKKGWEEGIRDFHQRSPLNIEAFMRPGIEKYVRIAAEIRDTQPGERWKRTVVRHSRSWVIGIIGLLFLVLSFGALSLWRNRHV